MVFIAATDRLQPVAYLDGIALGSKEALVISALWGLEDSETRPTRLLHFVENTVTYLDVPHNIVSLCRVNGRAGPTVLALTKTDHALQVFPELGSLEPIGRCIGSTLNRLHSSEDAQYACGMFGQVYRRSATNWSQIDAGLFNPSSGVDADQLRDLAGTDDDLITVGLFGRALRCRNRTWNELRLPTNASFEQVISDEAGTYWIGGDHGILIRGKGAEWEILNTATDTTIWGMASFRRRIYLCDMNRIWVYHRDSIEQAPVHFSLGRQITTYRLDASDFDLWSFGLYDVLRFDGLTWERMAYPGNL